MTTLLHRIQLASQSRSVLKVWLQEILFELSGGGELALVNLWGNRGSGKTTLLHEIGLMFQDIPDTFVFGPQDADQVSYVEISEQIIKAIDTASQATNKVVLIDNLESISMDNGADRPDFVDFETQLIMNLIQRSDILFIVTSRHELRQWHHIDIKMRQSSILIPPVEQGEIGALAEEIHLSPQQVYEITYGYPPALAWLKQNPGADNSEIDRLVAELLLKDLPQNVQEAALVTSLLLDFDVAVLQRAASAAGFRLGDTYHDYSSVVQKLGIAGFVVHDIRNGGYRFADHATRRLLSRIYRSRYPKPFDAIHKEMMEFYQKEARRSSFLPQFLVNAIYHMAWANERQGKRLTSHNCQEWVRLTIPVWVGADWQEVLIAWKTGRGNPDVVEEITHLIGKNAYQQIAKQIKFAGRS